MELLLSIVTVAVMVTEVSREAKKRQGVLLEQIKEEVGNWLGRFLKAGCRLLYALIYFLSFCWVLIIRWPEIESIFNVFMLGKLPSKLDILTVTVKGLLILLTGTVNAGLYEAFLRIVAKMNVRKVFDTITWLGNIALALIGALTIYYSVYYGGSIESDTMGKCLCTESAVSQVANSYLWNLAFYVFMGIMALDFYEVLRGINEKEVKCRKPK